MRLIVRDLKKILDDRIVLDGAAYSFRHGVVYGLVGNKDDGKTTFLKCISGEQKIDEGYVRLEADWKEYDIKYSDFGFVSEKNILPEYMTGYEFFENFVSIHPELIMENKTADDYFAEVGIKTELRDKLIVDYSEDDKRRLQILGILIVKPSVIIFDEIVKNYKKMQDFKAIIDSFKDRIVIIATDSYKIADNMCDEYICIEDGKIKSLNLAGVKNLIGSDKEDK